MQNYNKLYWCKLFYNNCYWPLWSTVDLLTVFSKAEPFPSKADICLRLKRKCSGHLFPRNLSNEEFTVFLSEKKCVQKKIIYDVYYSLNKCFYFFLFSIISFLILYFFNKVVKFVLMDGRTETCLRRKISQLPWHFALGWFYCRWLIQIRWSWVWLYTTIFGFILSSLIPSFKAFWIGITHHRLML